eukprot:208526_1
MTQQQQRFRPSCTHYLFAFVAALITLAESEWAEVTNPTLPRAGDSMAVGSYNDTIFILGGWNSKQVSEYNAGTGFTDIGVNILSSIIWGVGQYYASIDENIYLINPSGDHLSVYNMHSKTFTDNWSQNNNITNVGWYSCLAAFDHLLFVTGGRPGCCGTALPLLQIYDINKGEWTYGPQMNGNRDGHSCIISKSLLLFVIGGTTSVTFINSIEAINITNIKSQSWQSVGSLTNVAWGHRAILVNENIWVVGGKSSENYFDTVHIINPFTFQVTLSPESLAYGVLSPGVTIFNQIIYCFGGEIAANTATNSWQKRFLPTTNIPTTNNPTTDNPTTYTPTTISPTTINPTTINPTTNVPTTSNPTTFNPTTFNPTTFNPTTFNPTTFNP